MSLRVISADEIRQDLPMETAIDALDQAFKVDELPDSPQRSHLQAQDGELLLMPVSSDLATGVKLITINPSNPSRGLPLIQGVYVLFSDSLKPVAILDGAAVTKLRTAAVSGLATRYLALPEAHRLVLFGAGAQARAHLEAMCTVRQIRIVWIVERSPEKAAPLVEYARSMGLHAEVATADAVSEADIVCTCTTSAEPVFDGSLLRPGTHVVAMGSYKPDARELDDETIRRGRLIVETREAALQEAGDLLLPIQRGVIFPSDIVADLRELANGKAVRTHPEDITVFKSVGVAFEDLVIVGAAFERSEAHPARPSPGT